MADPDLGEDGDGDGGHDFFDELEDIGPVENRCVLLATFLLIQHFWLAYYGTQKAMLTNLISNVMEFSLIIKKGFVYLSIFQRG